MREAPHSNTRTSRRTLLRASASAVALAGAGALSAGCQSMPSATGGTFDPGPPADTGITHTERVYSRARGQDVNLVTILPKEQPPAGLPVSLLLHGRGGSAEEVTWHGWGGQLRDAVAEGKTRPFAFVSVDGGDNYWHEYPDGDDALGMLLDEIPRWLRERGLGGGDGQPWAATGVSMGGFGSLVYARRRRERGNSPGALAVVSPALFTEWSELRSRDAFTDEAQWAAIDPLRNPGAHGDVPLGVWCGTEDDRFIEGTRQFIAKADPTHADLRPGPHGPDFFQSVVGDVLGFLTDYVPKPG
ncbi:S-formylglutathione hydrolase FrmB [Tamaricihabitans halophyticus]|uniref:Acyl-CoA:diacylglycerol acyltransferase n=1 Tax=Tamaricihabitans halophyticus TaxID=1262583 RepID=A0A4R2QHD8_9PSEU|nr:alpha/beta hydrolase-fold protein [Tamaricihabitans halophyticus]TCP48567.1 S-formylglutathione hydrolase FrmB [Tamaricihabitans halophyticus]